MFWIGTSGSLAAQDQPTTVQAKKPVPSLSLRSLYHPKDKYDFDGSLPLAHWIGQTNSKLLLRRDDTWNEVDLESGSETPWSVVDRLAQQLTHLEGVNQEQAKKSAASAVRKLKDPSDHVLLRIGKSLALVASDVPARWLTRDASGWRNETIDPTAQKVAYTRDGDLYVIDAKTGQAIQLTSDGEETLLDGILDWTYQEEIYGRGNYRGFWFSPDGQWLAMLRIDISGIEPYFLPSSAGQRGKGIVRRYPKAGDPIPHASLLVWDLRQFASGKIPPAKRVAQSTPQEERIITGVWWWGDESKLAYCISDRLQTWRELRVATPMLTARGDESSLLLREESSAWVEPPESPFWLDDGSIVWQSDLPTGRTRLFQISPDGRRVTPLTPEDFDVRDFSLGSDGSQLIVTGDLRRGTVQRHAYRVTRGDQGKPVLVSITDQDGWHALSFSPDGRWMIDRFSTPAKPPTMSLRSTDGARHVALADSTFNVPGAMTEPDLFQIETGDGIPLPAMLIRPRTATNNSATPVVIEVYGGPQSPSVSARWMGTKTLYRELLARRGIATLVVDNRSSAGRGIADSWAIQRRVGEVEFKDLMEAVRWLKQQPWVDSDRLAIRGWSFGGFLTLYAMTHSDAFAAGIAGGSVTDWREYDAFYTERYMGLPSENEEGYLATAPVRKAADLQGHVLLIHGEADDNVHPSETMRMAKALQQAGKDFRLMIYPGAAHHVGDRKQAWHMVQMTDRFLIDQLNQRN